MAYPAPIPPETLGQADEPSSPVARFSRDEPLLLDAGVALKPWQIAYQTYGRLNASRSNAVLVCHALTGDQHVANAHPLTGKPGWWETMVGPGRPIDTERFFVLCANVVGGCMGTTGPASLNPETGQPYAVDFPLVTIRDMVRAQAQLLDRLGIRDLFCVVGGSMGGMQVLQWAAAYGPRVFAALPIATSARHTAQNIAFHEVGRQAVMADPDWRGGRYLQEGARPGQGPRRRPHGRAHHLPVRRGAAEQVRPALPGSGGQDLLLRRRFPDRVLPAPPGARLRGALRRQLLPLRDPGDGLLRPRGRLWRHARRAPSGGPRPASA